MESVDQYPRSHPAETGGRYIDQQRGGVVVLLFTPDAEAATQAEALSLPRFEAPVDILPPNSLAVGALDGLRIRIEPGLGRAVVATGGAGEILYLRAWSGVVAVDGAEWYSVAFAPGCISSRCHPAAQMVTPISSR